jgi:hypothetical protein
VRIPPDLERKLLNLGRKARLSAIAALRAYANCPSPTYRAATHMLTRSTTYLGWVIGLPAELFQSLNVLSICPANQRDGDGGEEQPRPPGTPSNKGPALAKSLGRTLEPLLAELRARLSGRHAAAAIGITQPMLLTRTGSGRGAPRLSCGMTTPSPEQLEFRRPQPRWDRRNALNFALRIEYALRIINHVTSLHLY